jgi:hypothetical protein
LKYEISNHPEGVMDLNKYRNERRAPRTDQVEVKGLAPYFAEDRMPLFKVRGLTAAELDRAREAAQRQRDTVKIAGALIGGDGDAKAEALRELMAGPEVPDKTATEIEILHLGCVDPVLQHSDAVLISEDFPIEFGLLVKKILTLTGAGRQLGKPSASGKTQTSEPR